MNRQDIAEEICTLKGYHSKKTRGDVSAMVALVFSIIRREVSMGRPVQVEDFGTFKLRTRAEREQFCPFAGKTMTIPKRHTPAFVPGKLFKEQSNDERRIEQGKRLEQAD